MTLTIIEDVSTADILFSIMRGACICSPSEHERLNDLAATCRKLKANWLFLTPSVASAVDVNSFSTVKTLLLGGEAPTHKNISDWAEKVSLHMVTGPAECSVYCMASLPVRPGGNPSNVGFATGCRTWIVEPDNHDVLSPLGCVGELCVEGRIVAREYLGDEFKTQASFIEEPSWLPSSSEVQKSLRPRRIYKTGDLVRYNNDGSISFIGRKDRQVKIRGQRVELGEIEYHISQSVSDVDQVVVCPIQNQGSKLGEALVAFLVKFRGDDTKNMTVATIGDLDSQMLDILRGTHETVSSKLPSYMLPTFYVPLTRIPLTANGKLDVASLEEIMRNISDSELIKFSLRDASNKSEQPIDKNGIALQSMWALILDLKEHDIGSRSNFFLLGGDSIKAIRLAQEARNRGYFNLTVSSILENPSLVDMASKMTENDMEATINPAAEVAPFSLLPIPYSSAENLIQQCSSTCHVNIEEIEDIYPCSPTQEAIFSSSMRNPGSYITSETYQLGSDVNILDFKEAWETVLGENDILRTRIILSETCGFLQIVLKRNRIHWNESVTQMSLPIDSGSPLVKFGVVESHNESSTAHFLITCHHALYDGFSFPLLFETAAKIYHGKSYTPLKPFKNYIQYLSGRAQTESESARFWEERLKGSQSLTWPTSIDSTPEKDSTKITRISVPLPEKAMQRASDFTLSEIIQSAFSLLLGEYTRSSDITFGLTVSGRDAPLVSILEINGPTLATVPMRITWDKAQRVQELIMRVRHEKSSIIDHQHMGLSKIRLCSSENGHACEIKTMLVIQPLNEPSDYQKRMQTRISTSEVVSSCPLTVECQIIGSNAVDIIAEFDSRAIGTVETERFIYQLGHVIVQLMSQPSNTPIADIDLVSSKDYNQISNWNSSANTEIDDTIHGCISRKMLECPDKEAVAAWDGKLTYQELDDLAARLAYHLESTGVGKEIIVPILAEKSQWVVVAVLAILRAGGAFLPIDISNPPGRVREMLSQTNSKHILVSPNMGAQVRVWNIGVDHIIDLSPSIAQLPTPPQPTEGKNAEVRPHDLAYVIFTSGSTGKPKGVLIEHTNIVTAALSRADAIHRTSDSRVYQFSSYAFDTCVEDMITTMLVGGTICIPSESDRTSDLVKSMNELQANAADLTPSLANILTPQDIPSLKVMILAGEAMTATNVRKWAPHLTLINTYGPAECSIVSTTAAPAKGGLDHENIGRATCGHSWIVDPEDPDKLLPIGAIGELLMEGPLVGRGYLNQPEKTAAVFLGKTSWAPAGSRIYKTGDLVRYREDGNIIFIGRKDSQIKIHGQRVEIGEIEGSIESIDNVAGAAVEFVNNSDIQQTLVAFIAFQNSRGERRLDEDISPTLLENLSEIKKELGESLPRYMVPSLFIPLPVLPITITGKLDRKGLRKLVDGLSKADLVRYRLVQGSTNSGDGPQNDTQTGLRQAWSEVLRVPLETISLRSHFFGLGGDSLSAMALASSARRHGLLLTIPHIFENPTLEDMSSVATEMAEKFDSRVYDEPFSLLPESVSVQSILESGELQLSVNSIEDIYPCTPLQEGFLMSSAKNSEAYCAQYVYKLSPIVDTQAFQTAWMNLVDENPILRTRIIYVNGTGSLQVVFRDPESSSLATYKTELHDYLLQDRSNPFTYGVNLSRFALVIDEAQNEQYFVLSAHHATFDAVSMELLLQRFSDIYTELPYQPKTPPSFKRFISHVANMDTESCRNFWTSQMKGAPSTEFLRPKGTSSSSPKRNIISHKTSFDSSQFAKENQRWTLATTVRAAWALVIAQYSEASDILFGAALSGRTAVVDGISEMVAPTMTTVPVRVIIDKELSIEQFLEQIQRQAVEMIPYEHYGLQKIQKLEPHATTFNTILDIQHDTSGKDQPWDHIMRSLELSVSNEEAEAYHVQSCIMECWIGKDCLELRANYDHAVVPQWQMQSILRCFGKVVEQLCYGGDKKARLISDISLCDTEDFNQIMEWNTTTPVKTESMIHDLVAHAASKHPGAMAIESWDGCLTFQELDTVTERLAAHLASLGSSFLGNLIVPICFDKSIFAVIAMLAVLRIGGTYVPLDPTYPASRLCGMIDQVHASVVITSSKYRPQFESQVNNVMVLDDSLLEEIQKIQCDFPLAKPTVAIREPSPNDHAMIIFTSGSTGKPKGVVITHESFCTLTIGLGKTLNLSESSRVLQFAAYAFDVSNAEIFMPLIHGGCVCIPSPEERINDLAGIINRKKVNWLYLTPTATTLLKGPEEVPTVRTLLLGGEAARSDIIDTWASSVELINTYGPAEGTIWPSVARFPPGSSPLNIGQGDNCHMWLVDPENHHRLVPIGAVGEILLEGPLLAYGYFEDENKTQAAFIHDPKWAKSYENPRRFYKTGDLARYNHDGTMSFCGRIGTMVKLRGQRLELGEVESYIKRCVSHKSHVCVELMKKPNTADKLVAFVTIDEEEENESSSLLSTSEVGITSGAQSREIFGQIQEYLRSHLPRYMHPSIYVPLTTMPRTASGKTDRKVLREWYKQVDAALIDLLSSTETVKRAPETPKEVHLRKLWSKVLNQDESKIGRDDEFFQIGGDSLSAMRLAATARDLGLSLTVTDIFLKRKLSQLALCLSDTFGKTPSALKPFELLGSSNHIQRFFKRSSPLWDIHNLKNAYPCTPLQEGLISLSNKRQDAYIANHTFRLPLGVDIAGFKSAWQSTVDGFDILRTRIISDPEYGFLQLVLHDEKIHWLSIDSLEDFPVGKAEHETSSNIIGGSLAGFYLVAPENAGKEWTFILRLHHAIFDANSLELMLSYARNTYSHDQTPTVSPYDSFVGHVIESRSERSKVFWVKELGSFDGSKFPDTSSMILDAAQAMTTYTHNTSVTHDKESPYTITTVLLAAWAIVLSIHSQSDDILFGQTLSGRDTPIPGIAEVGGPTIATIPRRIRVHADELVESFLSAVQNQSAELLAHQHFGLQNISSVIGSRNSCDFDSLLSIETVQKTTPSKSFLQEVHTADDGRYHTYPFVVQAFLERKTESNYSLEFSAVFDESRLDTWTVRNILSQISHVASQLQQTSRQIRKVSVCSPPEMVQMEEWNGDLNSPNPGQDGLVQSRILSWAQETPESIAIRGWDACLTYRELDTFSLKLSQILTERYDLSSEAIVGICFAKSAWVAVAALAVLRAGGSCLFIEANHPLERRLEIINQARCTVILADSFHASSELKSHAQVIEVTRSVIESVENPLTQSTVSPHSDDTASVVFTSGSTGKPKGILLTHRSILSWFDSFSSKLNISNQTRMLQFASAAFDAFTMEIFAALLAGGCLCIPSEHDRLNNLDGFIRETNVNWAFFTPTALTFLQPETTPSLKTVVMGGEMVKRHNIDQWAHRVELFSIYGPAECTICVCSVRLLPSSNPTNLGHAHGSSIWISDSSNPELLAPLGALGEICIQGPLVSKGYIHDAERTAMNFLDKTPWSSPDWKPNMLGFSMYRTGDLGRYNVDGTLTYIGRKDKQVKLRGQRIELGEVEDRIRSAINQPILVATEVVEFGSASQGPTLATFFDIGSSQEYAGQLADRTTIGAGGWKEKIEDLQNYLTKTLPSYMVPSVYVILLSIPLTATGKIDRRQLLEISKTLDYTQLRELMAPGTRRLPSTKTELLIQSLWASSLKVDPSAISADDTWVQVGGDSIQAVLFVAKARSHGLKVTVSALLSSSTLAVLADECDKNGVNSDITKRETPVYSSDTLLGNEIVASELRKQFETVHTRTTIQHIVEATDFQSEMLSAGMQRSRGWNNYLRMSIDGTALDVTKADAALHALVAHHDILRTVLLCHKGQVYQCVLESVELQIQTSLQVDNLEKAAQRWIDQDIRQAPTLDRPILRASIITSSSDGHGVLILGLSHALYDGMSLPTIRDDWSLAYNGQQLTSNGPSFVLYSQQLVHQRKSTSHQERALQFWRGVLDGSSMTEIVHHSLPLYECPIDQTLSRKIAAPRQELSQHGFTFPTLLKLAWAIVLSQWSQRSDVVFGHLVSGRAGMEVPIDGMEAIVGPCINLVPVRINVGKLNTILGLMKSIHQQHLDSLPYETTGFRQIIHECTDWPNWARFSSIVQHQNIQGVDDILSSHQPTGLVCPEHDSADVWIISVPEDEGRSIRVDLNYSREIISDVLATTLLDELCKVMQLLAQQISDGSIPTLSVAVPTLPLNSPLKISEEIAAVDSGVATQAEISYKKADVFNIEEVVEECWKATGLRHDAEDTTPFYDLSGDLIPALQMQSIIKEKLDLAIEIEEFVRKPTKKAQRVLLRRELEKRFG